MNNTLLSFSRVTARSILSCLLLASSVYLSANPVPLLSDGDPTLSEWLVPDMGVDALAPEFSSEDVIASEKTTGSDCSDRGTNRCFTAKFVGRTNHSNGDYTLKFVVSSSCYYNVSSVSFAVPKHCVITSPRHYNYYRGRLGYYKTYLPISSYTPGIKYITLNNAFNRHETEVFKFRVRAGFDLEEVTVYPKSGRYYYPIKLKTACPDDDPPPAKLELECSDDVTNIPCGTPLPRASMNAIQLTSTCTVGNVGVRVADHVTQKACDGKPLIITRTYRAWDECGNDVKCTQRFVYQSEELAAICPGDKTLDACADEDEIAAAFEDFKDGFDATGGCNAKVYYKVNGHLVSSFDDAHAPNCGESVTLRIIVQDACGEWKACSSTFKVPEEDNTPPPSEITLDCPDDVTNLPCGSDVPAPNVNDVQASTTCDDTPPVCEDKGWAGCIDAVFKNRVENANGTTTFTFKVCTRCHHDVSNVAFVIADGVEIVSPANGSTYKGLYKVVSPVKGDKNGIKFETIGDTFNNGECEQFVFTVRGDVDDVRIETKAATETYTIDLDVVCEPGNGGGDGGLEVVFMGDETTGSGCAGDPIVVTRTYKATDDCGNEETCEQKFVFDVATLDITCSEDILVPSCTDETTINGQYTAFLNGFSADGNCDVSTTYTVNGMEFDDVDDIDVPAPGIGGGVVTVVFSATNGCADEAENCERTFTVEAPTGGGGGGPLVISCPDDLTVEECGEFEAMRQKYRAFLDEFQIVSGGGSNPRYEINGEIYTSRKDIESFVPRCDGGSVKVKFLVEDDCTGEDKMCMATFTVPTPADGPLRIECPDNQVVELCGEYEDMRKKYREFLDGFVAIGGCEPVGVKYMINGEVFFDRDDIDENALRCDGGTAEVSFWAFNDCNPTRGSIDCTRTFEVPTPPDGPLRIECPENQVVELCGEYEDMRKKYRAFLDGFVTIGGCEPVGVKYMINGEVFFDRDDIDENALRCDGGTAEVSFWAFNDCNPTRGSIDCTRTFEVPTPPDGPLDVFCPKPVVVDGCDDQADIDAAYENFLNGFGSTGGCEPVGSKYMVNGEIFFDRADITVPAPGACGGVVEVSFWSFNDCNPTRASIDCTSTFTVTPCSTCTKSNTATTTVEVEQPENDPVDGLTTPLTVATLSVYPNPTSGNVSLSLPEWQDQRVDLHVRDLMGRVVLTRTVAQWNTAVNDLELSELSAGTYIIQLRNASGEYKSARVVLLNH